jgi:hypothetical protein
MSVTEHLDGASCSAPGSFILIVAALFKISDFISANRTPPFPHATDLAQMADDIERWERGEPRQQTLTVLKSYKNVLVSRLDQ